MAKTTQYNIQLKEEVSAGLRNIEAKLAGTNQKLAEFQAKGAQAFDAGKVMAYGAAAVLALGKIADFTGQAVRAYADFQEKQLRLEAQLKVTGNQLGLTANQVLNLASALEDATGIDDADILNAISVMQTFENVTGSTFKEAITQAANMSVVFGDVDTAARQLGAALENPSENLDKLKKASVYFTDAEKAQIKAMQDSGDLMGAQAIVLDKIKSKYDGLAESINTGVNGSLRNLANAWDDSMKSMGQAFTTWVQPAIDGITNFLKTANANNLLGRTTRAQEAQMNGLSGLVQGLGSARTPQEKDALTAQILSGAQGLEASGYDLEAVRAAVRTVKADLDTQTAKIGRNLSEKDRAELDSAKLAAYYGDIDRKLGGILGVVNTAQKNGEAGKRSAPAALLAGGEVGMKDMAFDLPNLDGPAGKNLTIAEALIPDVDDPVVVGMIQRSAKEVSEAYEKARRDHPIEAVMFDLDQFVSKNQKLFDSISDGWDQVSKSFSLYQQLQDQGTQANLDRMRTELDTYEASQDLKIEVARRNGEDTTQLEVDKANEVYSKKKELAEAERKAKRQAWEAQRSASVTEALMSGGVAAVKALQLLPNVPLAIAMGVIAAGTTAANVAMISGQPMPAFAKGGIVPGNLFSGDQVLSRLNSGEMVLNKPQQAALFKLANGGGSGQPQTVIQIENVYGSVDQEFVDNLAKAQGLRDYRGI